MVMASVLRRKRSSWASTALVDYKRIYGTNQNRIDKLKTAFTNIMQSGVEVSLIE